MHPAGAQNTFFGSGAGANTTSGYANSGFGFNALKANTTGYDNTATGGLGALGLNTTGSYNTATGQEALGLNTTGNYNTATGADALGNTTGNYNTATGMVALVNNTTGSENTATGEGTLYLNTTGSENTAIGVSALVANSTGMNNIAVGSFAGKSLTTGSYNIDIGNFGVTGESNTIRIGSQGIQTATYITGIFGATVGLGWAPVLIDPSGHLGTGKPIIINPPIFSSARYKRDIRDMGDASAGLLKLRPVSFRYKEDPDGALQYGLIAEEVERVYPELVTHGDDGKVEGVRYELLPAMLLNEVQKLAKENRRLVAQVDALKQKEAQIDALVVRMKALERQVRAARPERLASTLR